MFSRRGKEPNRLKVEFTVTLEGISGVPESVSGSELFVEFARGSKPDNQKASRRIKAEGPKATWNDKIVFYTSFLQNVTTKTLEEKKPLSVTVKKAKSHKGKEKVSAIGTAVLSLEDYSKSGVRQSVPLPLALKAKVKADPATPCVLQLAIECRWLKLGEKRLASRTPGHENDGETADDVTYDATDAQSDDESAAFPDEDTDISKSNGSDRARRHTPSSIQLSGETPSTPRAPAAAPEALAELEDLRRDKARLERRLEKLQAAEKGHEGDASKVAGLTAELASLREDKERLEAQLAAARQQLEQERAKGSTSDSVAAELTAEREAAAAAQKQREKDQMQEKLAREKDRIQIATLDALSKDLQRRLDDALTRAEAATRAEELEAKLAAAAEELAALQSENAVLVQKLEAAEASRTVDMRRRLHSAESMKSLQTQSAELQHQLQEARRTHEEQVQALQASLEQERRLRAEAESAVASATAGSSASAAATAELNAAIVRLETSLEEARRETEAASRRAAELQEQLETRPALTSQIDELNQSLRKSRKDNELLEAQLETLTVERHRAASERQAHLAQLEQQVGALEDDNAALKTREEQTRMHHQAELAELNQSLRRLQEEKQTLADRIQEMAAARGEEDGTLSKEVARLTGLLDAAEQEKAALKREVRESQARADELAVAVTRLETNNRQLEERLEEMAAARGEEDGALSKEVARLTGLLDAAEQEKAALKREVRESQARADELAVAVTRLETSSRQLEERLERAELVAAAAAEAQPLKDRVADLERLLSDAQSKAKDADSSAEETAELRARIEHLEEQLAEAAAKEDEAAEVAEQARTLAAKMESLMRLIPELEAKAQQAEQAAEAGREAVAIKARAQQLEQQLAELQEKEAASRQRADDLESAAAQLRAELESAKSQAADPAELAALRDQVQQLEEANAAAARKAHLSRQASESQVTDLNATVRAIQEDNETLREQLEELTAGLAKAKDDERLIAELRERIEELEEAVAVGKKSEEHAKQEADQRVAHMQVVVEKLQEQNKSLALKLVQEGAGKPQLEQEVLALQKQLNDVEAAYAEVKQRLEFKEQNELSEEDLERLNNRIEQLQTENRAYKRQFKELADVPERLKAKEEELATARQETEELHLQVEELQNRKSSSKSVRFEDPASADELDALKLRIENLEEEVRTLEDENRALAEAKEASASSEERLREAEAQLAEQTRLLGSADEEHRAKVDALQERIRQLEAASDGAAQLSELHERIEELQTQLKEAEARAALVKDQAELDSDAREEAVRQRLALLEQQLAAQQDREGGEDDSRLRQAEEEARLLRDRVPQLETLLEEAESELRGTRSLQKDLDELDRQRSENVRQLRTTLDGVERQLEESEARRKEAEEQAQQSARQAEMSAEIEQLTDKVSRLERQLEESEERVRQAQARTGGRGAKAGSDSEDDDSDGLIQELQLKVASLEEQLEEAETSRRAAERQAARGQNDKVAQLEKQVAELTATLEQERQQRAEERKKLQNGLAGLAGARKLDESASERRRSEAEERERRLEERERERELEIERQERQNELAQIESRRTHVEQHRKVFEDAIGLHGPMEPSRIQSGVAKVVSHLFAAGVFSLDGGGEALETAADALELCLDVETDDLDSDSGKLLYMLAFGCALFSALYKELQSRPALRDEIDSDMLAEALEEATSSGQAASTEGANELTAFLISLGNLVAGLHSDLCGALFEDLDAQLAKSAFYDSLMPKSRGGLSNAALAEHLVKQTRSIRAAGLSDKVASELVANLLRHMDTYFFNVLVDRKAYTAGVGFKVKMGLSQLKEAVGKLDKPLAQQVDQAFGRVVEAANLLSLPKSMVEDEDTARDVFPLLNPQQLRHFVQHFSPDDAAPDPVSPQVLRSLQQTCAKPANASLKVKLDELREVSPLNLLK